MRRSFVEVGSLSLVLLLPCSAQLSLLDRSFDPGSGVAGGAVETMALQPDGKVLLGGNFTSFDGQPVRYLARLNLNGKLDPTFQSDVGYWVRAIAVQPDGKILIGGFFQDVEGQKRPCIARLDDKGRLDTTFSPGSGCQGRVVLGDTTNPFVYAIALQHDGQIIIAGNFTSYNGTPRNAITRLNPDGSVDNAFNVGSGANSWLRSLTVQDNGQILVSGWLTSYNNQGFNRMVRLNPDGSADPSLNPFFGDRTAIYTMVPLADGKIVVGGHSVNTNAPFRAEIVRLNPDGVYDPAFNPGGEGANDKVESIARQADGKLVIGGYFNLYNNTLRRNLARLNPDGTLDETFTPEADNWIYNVAIQPDGRILVSGGFNAVDGIPRSGVARLLPNPAPPGPKPTIAITAAPPERARLSNSVVTLSGTASGQVTEVLFSVGDQPFTPAVGTTNWSATAQLVPGQNTCTVKAMDSWGSESDPATRDLFYVATSTITLITNGTGRIVPQFRSTQLVIGDYYSIKAVPAPGQLFTNWTGSVESMAALLQFQMQPDMVLQANFIPDPFPPLRGVYQGLFHEPAAITHQSSGFIRINLTTNRVFTGRLEWNGRTNSFNGRFSEQAIAELRIVRPNQRPIIGSLQLDIQNQQIHGTLGNGTWTADLLANRAVFNQNQKATNYAGRYTLLLPSNGDALSSPGGNGFATVIVNMLGDITMAGALPNGRVISQSTKVSKDGKWPLYVNLFNGKGSLLCWATFTETATSPIEGEASWIELPTRRQFYPGGFTNTIQLLGSRYQTPQRGQPVVNLSNTQLLLDGGNLDEPLSISVVPNPNRPLAVNSNTNQVRLLFNPTNGILTGSFLHPVTHKFTPVRGVALQQLNQAGGFFRGTNHSGGMLLKASTEAE